MSQVADRIVISEGLIQDAVRSENDQIDEGSEAISTNLEAVEFSDITELMLSYKHVWEINNLSCLTSLQKLCLDNNVIENIQNLQPRLTRFQHSCNIARKIIHGGKK